MEADERRPWTLLTSHGHVLVEIARNPQARVRDISAAIGITERATQAIIADLERAGYVERIRVGRRTNYVLHGENPFRHTAQDGLRVGPFLELLAGGGLGAVPLAVPALPAVPAVPAEPAVPALPAVSAATADPALPAMPAAPAIHTVPIAPIAPISPVAPEPGDGLTANPLEPPEPGPAPGV